MALIPMTDLKQWAYCPRIVYYHRVIGAAGRPTYKMREALAAQELIESLEMRRGLREYGLEAARRHFGLWLEDEVLGLSGKLDLLLVTESEIAVVDFKLTSGEPGQNHRMQLAGYSLLAEKAFGVPAGRAFLYRIPDGQVFTVGITEEMKAAVKRAVEGVRSVEEEQHFPAATEVRGRCVECEYMNFCGDVW